MNYWLCVTNEENWRVVEERKIGYISWIARVHSRRTRSTRNDISMSLRHSLLGFYGEPGMPILYRRCRLDANNVEKFVMDVLDFFEDVGYAEV